MEFIALMRAVIDARHASLAGGFGGMWRSLVVPRRRLALI